jgi:hypothetical protein
VELWSYEFPLNAERTERLAAGIRAIPKLLEQAKRNLVGDKADLWTFGTRSIKEQSADLERLASRVAGAQGSLKADVQRAKEATDAFAAWLDAQAPSKRAPSGVGVENYDWYLKNVQLVPYTWQDEVTIMERELARAHAFLALEERRNAALPVQVPIATADDFNRKFSESVTQYMSFLKDHDIMTVRDYMEPALRARIGTFAAGPREFFSEVDYRDREVMLTHSYHWFDLAQMAKDPHRNPIRRGALLYNMFITRTEGHATGWEEMMLQAGMFDARPAVARADLRPPRPAGGAGARRSPDARQPVQPRGRREVCVGQHPARLAAPGGQHRPRRTASLSHATGVRHQLRHRQDPDRRTARREKTSARRRLHHEEVHGRLQCRRHDPRVARALGDDGGENNRGNALTAETAESAEKKNFSQRSLRALRSRRLDRRRYTVVALLMRAHSRLSTSACRLASMMFSLTPIVPHSWTPSVDWISTRVVAAVPLVESMMRTL